MSPRPRKASDAQVFDAAARVMRRLAPGQWTLADIAAEAGVTASALVQRFGSRQALVAALGERLADDTPAAFAALRAAHPSPLAALRAHADAFAGMGARPGDVAHHLAYLHLDLSDPQLHTAVRRQSRAGQAALRALLEDAVAPGELRTDADAPALAGMVETVLAGSLLVWAIRGEGEARDWLRRDLDALLRPWLPGAPA